MHPMDVVLIALVLTCGITDIFFDRIYNPVTIAGIASGWIVAAIGRGPPTLSGETITGSESVTGFLMGFLPMLFLFLLGGVGGGDVKLMGAIGAIKGAPFVAYTMLYSLFLGALFGVVSAAATGTLGAIMKRVGATGLHMLGAGSDGVTPPVASGPRVKFGLATCFGTLVCMMGQLLSRQLLDL
jgi:prepilin peptidase CpaA